MCTGKKPKRAAVPAPAPRKQDPEVRNARAKEKRRQKAAAGRSSTLLLGGDFGDANTTGGAVLLGE